MVREFAKFAMYLVLVVAVLFIICTLILLVANVVVGSGYLLGVG